MSCRPAPNTAAAFGSLFYDSIAGSNSTLGLGDLSANKPRLLRRRSSSFRLRSSTSLKVDNTKNAVKPGRFYFFCCCNPKVTENSFVRQQEESKERIALSLKSIPVPVYNDVPEFDEKDVPEGLLKILARKPTADLTLLEPLTNEAHAAEHRAAVEDHALEAGNEVGGWKPPPTLTQSQKSRGGDTAMAFGEWLNEECDWGSDMCSVVSMQEINRLTVR
eukprot:GHVR01076894.1.p1 GENE.GHVR01076894.1~~GHVR01076894.1.p1  ORF type:complete len:219 (+),score=40.55 GHVR01076894.1:18-674(+)